MTINTMWLITFLFIEFNGLYVNQTFIKKIGLCQIKRLLFKRKDKGLCKYTYNCMYILE